MFSTYASVLLNIAPFLSIPGNLYEEVINDYVVVVILSLQHLLFENHHNIAYVYFFEALEAMYCHNLLGKLVKDHTSNINKCERKSTELRHASKFLPNFLSKDASKITTNYV